MHLTIHIATQHIVTDMSALIKRLKRLDSGPVVVKSVTVIRAEMFGDKTVVVQIAEPNLLPGYGGSNDPDELNDNCNGLAQKIRTVLVANVDGLKGIKIECQISCY